MLPIIQKIGGILKKENHIFRSWNSNHVFELKKITLEKWHAKMLNKGLLGRWASSTILFAVNPELVKIYITLVAKRMMRIIMISTTMPMITINLMFFHQYFLATRVEVLWNESAWKEKKNICNLNKVLVMEETLPILHFSVYSTDFTTSLFTSVEEYACKWLRVVEVHNVDACFCRINYEHSFCLRQFVMCLNNL